VAARGSLSLIAWRRLSTIVCLAFIDAFLASPPSLDVEGDEEDGEEVLFRGVIGARREFAVAVVAVLRRADRSEAWSSDDGPVGLSASVECWASASAWRVEERRKKERRRGFWAGAWEGAVEEEELWGLEVGGEEDVLGLRFGAVDVCWGEAERDEREEARWVWTSPWTCKGVRDHNESVSLLLSLNRSGMNASDVPWAMCR
jgi:hypothetical protein